MTTPSKTDHRTKTVQKMVTVLSRLLGVRNVTTRYINTTTQSVEVESVYRESLTVLVGDEFYTLYDPETSESVSGFVSPDTVDESLIRIVGAWATHGDDLTEEMLDTVEHVWNLEPGSAQLTLIKSTPSKDAASVRGRHVADIMRKLGVEDVSYFNSAAVAEATGWETREVNLAPGFVTGEEFVQAFAEDERIAGVDLYDRTPTLTGTCITTGGTVIAVTTYPAADTVVTFEYWNEDGDYLGIERLRYPLSHIHNARYAFADRLAVLDKGEIPEGVQHG